MGAKNVPPESRNLLVQFLLESCTNGKPQRGKINEAAVKFSISTSCVGRLWRAARAQKDAGQPVISVSKMKSRKKYIKHVPDPGKIQALHLRDRTAYRKMSPKLHISKSTLCRWKQIGIFRAHTSALKPCLTADNKFIRLKFSLDALELDRILNKIRFQSMNNIIHIDEKWFFITKGSNRYYLTPEEEEPYRACQSKKFIGKIMFMCAVARPMLNEDGIVLFDGKIGIFPFTEKVQAARNSKNRKKGTWETKAIPSVTRSVIRDCLINKILPAIRAKWPATASKTIYIQQDNARPHITDSDPEFRAEAMKDGFNITLVQQPPNSPDCNVNDLGFFNAIQSLQQERVCKNCDDLVAAVHEAFYELTPCTLNKVFLSLQCCMTEIMKGKGHNKYKLPHMGKDAMIRSGTLPTTLEVPLELARECIDYLIQQGQINGIEQLMHNLGMQQITGIL